MLGRVREKGVIEVRASGPLVRVRFVGRASAEAHAEARTELARLFASLPRFGVVVDLREARMPGAADQRRMMELLVRHRARLASACVGFAIIVRGRVGHAALGALGWFAPPPVPLRTFRHAMGAEAFVRERLEGAKAAVAG
jgi:hypothetical protein